MTHQHIWSFCNQPGCRDKPYHPNTEDLVSPPCTTEDIKAYFADTDGGGSDDYAILTCEGTCPNDDTMWLYIRRGDPLMRAIRPLHYRDDADTLEQGSSWAKQHSDGKGTFMR